MDRLTFAADTRARSSVVFPENIGPHMTSILPPGVLNFPSVRTMLLTAGRVVSFSVVMRRPTLTVSERA